MLLKFYLLENTKFRKVIIKKRHFMKVTSTLNIDFTRKPSVYLIFFSITWLFFRNATTAHISVYMYILLAVYYIVQYSELVPDKICSS
jgi:hypothetical protein